MKAIKDGINDKYIWGIDRISSSSRYLFATYLFQSSSYSSIFDFKSGDVFNIHLLHTEEFYGLPISDYFVTGDYVVSHSNAYTFNVMCEYVLKPRIEEAGTIYMQEVADVAKSIKSDDNGVLVLYELKGMDDE